MPNVIDNIYDLQGWDTEESLDINSVKLILDTKDAFENVYNKYKPVKRNVLENIIDDLKEYKLSGSRVNSLIKDFSNENKVNIDFLARILEENGMKRSDLMELLDAALGKDENRKDFDINSLEIGLDKISTVNYNF